MNNKGIVSVGLIVAITFLAIAILAGAGILIWIFSMNVFRILGGVIAIMSIAFMFKTGKINKYSMSLCLVGVVLFGMSFFANVLDVPLSAVFMG